MTELRTALTKYINSCLTKTEGEETSVFDTDEVVAIIKRHTPVQDDDLHQRISDYIDECMDDGVAPDADEILDLINR